MAWKRPLRQLTDVQGIAKRHAPAGALDDGRDYGVCQPARVEAGHRSDGIVTATANLARCRLLKQFCAAQRDFRQPRDVGTLSRMLPLTAPSR